MSVAMCRLTGNLAAAPSALCLGPPLHLLRPLRLLHRLQHLQHPSCLQRRPHRRRLPPWAGPTATHCAAPRSRPAPFRTALSAVPRRQRWLRRLLLQGSSRLPSAWGPIPTRAARCMTRTPMRPAMLPSWLHPWAISRAGMRMAERCRMKSGLSVWPRSLSEALLAGPVVAHLLPPPQRLRQWLSLLLHLQQRQRRLERCRARPRWRQPRHLLRQPSLP